MTFRSTSPPANRLSTGSPDDSTNSPNNSAQKHLSDAE
jgi:hypothetical protein